MRQKWSLAPGTVFWIDSEKGFIVNPLKHIQFECKPDIILFLSGKDRKISNLDFLYLKDNGVIEFFDQDAFFKKLIKLKEAQPFDGIMYLEITKKCNLKCIGCYNDSGMQNRGELTLDKAIEISNILKKIGSPRVIITGGEPLVVNRWTDIISVFSRQFATEIFSNGTLITRPVAEQLKAINVSGVKISMDGATASTHDRLRGTLGSFDRSISGIRNLQEVGIPVTWQATISKANIGELKEMIDFAESVGVDYFKASPLRSIGRAEGSKLALSAEEELRLTKTLENCRGRNMKISSGESFCDVNEEWRKSQSYEKLTLEKEHIPFVSRPFLEFSFAVAGDERGLIGLGGGPHLRELWTTGTEINRVMSARPARASDARALFS